MNELDVITSCWHERGNIGPFRFENTSIILNERDASEDSYFFFYEKRNPTFSKCVISFSFLFFLFCNRSGLSMLESRVWKPEDFLEPKAISPLIVQENLSIPAKSWVQSNRSFIFFFSSIALNPPHNRPRVRRRSRRLSDQRRAELEALVTLSKINGKRSLTTRGSRQLDPEIM